MPDSGKPKHNGFDYHKPGCMCSPCKSKRGEGKKLKPLEGGDPNHKSGCRCPVCRALRRKAQAVALAVRNGTPPPPEIEEKDILYTEGPPTIRSRIAAWVAMRAEEPGISMAEASRRMGLAVSSLNSMVSRAVKEGWLRFDDPLDRIEHELIPTTIDNLAEFLKDKNEKVTIEVAKGTIFRQFQQSKGTSDHPQTILALKIEMQGTGENIKVVSGHVVGKPRILEGEEVG